MPGLLLIAHAPLASAFRQAAAHAFPEQAAHLLAIDIPADQGAAEIEAAIADALATLRASRGPEVLVLTDVFGATPCNVMQRLADGVQVKVVTGLNVPMLWRTLNYQDEALDLLVTRAQAGGTQGVMQVASSRPQNQASQPTRHDQDHRHHQQ